MKIFGKRITYLFAVTVVLLTVVTPLTAQGRGPGQDEVPEFTIGGVPEAGKQWAVLIAIDKYQDGWGDLKHPVNDAQEIQAILQERYVIDNWHFLRNEQATAEGIRSLFRSLRQEVAENDSVFVFHAGHGVKDDDTDKGAWITYDAAHNRNTKNGWLPHEEICSFLDNLPAHHVFLISDSCYAGDLLTVHRAGALPQFNNVYFRRAYAIKSRQVMTSGASETVPDESDFARLFKAVLNGTDGLCIDPQEIFMQVRGANGSTPRLGIMPTGRPEIDGSFLFLRKRQGNLWLLLR